MSLDQLQRKLLAAAKANPPGDRVPYAFEKRVLARLASAPVPDLLTVWATALWRSAGTVAALALAVYACSFFLPAEPAASSEGAAVAAVGAANDEQLSIQLESTLLASVDQNLNGSDDAQ